MNETLFTVTFQVRRANDTVDKRLDPYNSTVLDHAISAFRESLRDEAWYVETVVEDVAVEAKHMVTSTITSTETKVYSR